MIITTVVGIMRKVLLRFLRAKFDNGDYPSKHEPAWALCVLRNLLSNNMKVKTTSN